MAKNKKKRQRKIAQVPGTVEYIGKKITGNISVEIVKYNESFYSRQVFDNADKALNIVENDKITWLNITGLSNEKAIESIGNHYKLHPLLLEDISNTYQRPKFDEFEDYLFVVVKMLYVKEEKLQREHLSFVLGKNYLVTFQEADGDVFNEVRTRIENSKGRLRRMGPDYLLYALMDAVIDNYFDIIEELSDHIESIEDHLFYNKSNANLTYQIQELKREALRIRKAVIPLRDVANRIDKLEHPLLALETSTYFSDLHDHLIQISESVEIYREMIWGLMDMYMTSISNRMNEVMKTLTIIATIFIPLTFIAGIYGMNFKYMPELEYKFSYFILWGVMILVFLGLIYYFRRKKWL